MSTITFDQLIAEMLSNPPDPNEPLPLGNRRGTILGTTVPFLACAWLAVALRLHVRFRIMREPGWDDALVFLAALLNSVGTICVLVSIRFGLGQHFLYLGLPKMMTYTKMFYIENAVYVSSTAIIKLSLLTQYLRIFKAGTLNWICKSLIIIIGLWGVAYGFMAWFPCFPPQAFWQRQAYPDAICYGFGFLGPAFVSMFESHTALNMVFDFTIFITPMVLFTKPSLKLKNIIAMLGIFVLGGIVVLISIWRMYTIVENRAATSPYLDFTWWPPVSIILSCVEIDIAIMCASIPIFWPVIEDSFTAIFVTSEVHVTEQRRYSFAERSLAYELEHGREMHSRQESVQSSTHARSISRESLIIARQKSGNDMDEHYKDPYLAAQVDPFGIAAQELEIGVKTDVEAKPKDKWVL